ncbi:MAG: tetratricopeptide repeat protein [Deltaproteobacteria bacterium]|nr:tetratricopeptide repeat protein [Deltaproteobacteria bacterium]
MSLRSHPGARPAAVAAGRGVALGLVLLVAATAAADTFVLLPFRNAPGYKELDHLVAGVPALWAEKLEASKGITAAYGPRLLPDGARVPTDDADAGRQAAAVGARWAIVGTLGRRPNWDTELEVRVLEVAGEVVREQHRGSASGPKEKQLEILDRLLGGAAAAAGLLPEGTVALERFHRPATKDLYALYLYGRAVGVYHGLGPGQRRDLEKVESGLRKAVVVDPKFVEAQRFLALVLEEQGDGRAARGEYTAVVERRPTSFWAHQALARLYRAEGQKARALDAATRALKLRPADAATRFLRGEVLWELGRVDESYAELKQVAREAPRHAGARRLLAQVCSSRHAFEEQAQELEVLRQLQPDDLQARFDLGAAYLRLERWDRAAGVYDELCRKSPKHFMAHKLLGDLYRRKHDYLRAAVAYEQAMRIDPKDPRPYFLLAQTLAEGGNYDRADKVLGEAQQFKQYLGEAYNNLGAIAIKREDHARAGAYLRRALIRLPDRPRVRYNYGLALAGTRQLDKALEQFRLAIKLDPIEPEYHVAAGVTLLRLGRIDEAEQLFRHAVVVGDGHAGAARNLALIDELRRRRAEDEVVTPNIAGPSDAGVAPDAASPRAGAAPARVAARPTATSQTASGPALEQEPRAVAKKAKGKAAKGKAAKGKPAAKGTVSGRRHPAPKRPTPPP